MENTFFAQPYDIDANGFYFSTMEDYTTAVKSCRNAYGQRVEEFELQFIDGHDLDGKLFNALGINQANLHLFLDRLENWSSDDKVTLIIAVGDGGYSFDLKNDDPSDIELTLYADVSLNDLALQFVDDGLYGEIPPSLMHYIDYDAIARDLSLDYVETTICGDRYVYYLA